jgi:7,8-dihydro-6-hydroxymethylpterin dimethyltransferase
LAIAACFAQQAGFLKAIEEQTEGELKVENLIAPCCEESHCSFSSLAVLGEDGILIPTTHSQLAQKVINPFSEDTAERSRKYVRRHWKYREPNHAVVQTECCSTGACCDFFQSGDDINRILSHSLCVSGMAFQDAWNIDLERLQRCCVHVMSPERKLIPFCAYYMTDTNGRRMIDGRK